jgi:hypothetical protein
MLSTLFLCWREATTKSHHFSALEKFNLVKEIDNELINTYVTA